MKRIERIRLLLLVVAICIIVAALGAALRDDRKKIFIQEDTGPSEAGSPTVEIQNFSYTSRNDDNFKEWEIHADTARHFRQEQLVEMVNLNVVFFRKNGSLYRLTGSRGRLETDSRNIMITDGAVATLPDNTTIRTESFVYNHENNSIKTDDPIQIRRGGFSVDGVGMRVDLSAQTLSILNKVNATGVQ